MVVSNIFFQPYVAKWSNLASIFFSTGWVDFNQPSSCSNVRVGAFNLTFFRQIVVGTRHWCRTFSAPRLLSGWTCNLGLQMLALRPTKKNGRRKSRLSGSPLDLLGDSFFVLAFLEAQNDISWSSFKLDFCIWIFDLKLYETMAK